MAAQLQRACRRLLSEQNRDPYSPAFGCFDRRFWAWKLVDYPEVTFQRNAFALACSAGASWSSPDDAVFLLDAAASGLAFAARLQHEDGSFDQAFPHEHSYGATAFLLCSLQRTFALVRCTLGEEQRESIEQALRKAAAFLCAHDEEHGHIANHLAGAALALYQTGADFDVATYTARADVLIDRILQSQSTEGWFREYDGADPGYQTLCLHYLAQVQRVRPQAKLAAALQRSVEFLAWFVHPDGTFGGEYGSRRTSLFYPGGFCALASESRTAAAIATRMIDAIEQNRTTTLDDVDIANYAPVFESYSLALTAPPVRQSAGPLPYQATFADRDFPEAGLHVRCRPGYFAVVGVSNGGVLRVHDRASGDLRSNDCGFVGCLSGRRWISTQFTDRGRRSRYTSETIDVEARFYFMPRAMPTPMKFIVLRLLNLTVFRSLTLGNRLKRFLVALLMTRKRATPLVVRRAIRFGDDRVVVTDIVKADRPVRIDRLESGRSFRAIHMASAGYVEHLHADRAATQPRRLDAAQLAALSAGGEISLEAAI